MVAINPSAAIKNNAGNEGKTRFRWVYIILPVSFFLLSIILAASFFPFLSDEIAYHFQNGAPDKWLSLSAFIGWMVLPQLFFTILSFAVVKLVMLTSRYLPTDDSPLKKLLPVMGNMIALPQIILTFAMLDFFLYNVHQIRLIPVWIFAIIILVLGGIILAVLFLRAIGQSRRQRDEINKRVSNAE